MTANIWGQKTHHNINIDFTPIMHANVCDGVEIDTITVNRVHDSHNIPDGDEDYDLVAETLLDHAYGCSREGLDNLSICDDNVLSFLGL